MGLVCVGMIYCLYPIIVRDTSECPTCFTVFGITCSSVRLEKYDLSLVLSYLSSKKTMTTTTSFAAFTDGADVIQRTLDVVQCKQTQHDQINTFYEIEECVEWIKSNELKRVCEHYLDVP